MALAVLVAAAAMPAGTAGALDVAGRVPGVILPAGGGDRLVREPPVAGTAARPPGMPAALFNAWHGRVADFAPPDPHPVLKRQPDGTTFLAYVRGAEIGAGLVTPAGYTVVRRPDGWWVYAAGIDAAGRYVPSDRVVGRDDPAGLPREIGRRAGSIWEAADGTGDVRLPLFDFLRQKFLAAQAEALAEEGQLVWKVPALMIRTKEDFGDDETPDVLERRLSGIGTNPTGSVTELYLEMSYGKFRVQIDVYGPYESPASRVDPCFYGYAGPAGLPGGLGAWGMALEAVPQADPEIDFSQYDNDGDGYVDFLLMIHSGPGAEATGDTCDTWSHYFPIATVPTTDGVVIQGVMTVPSKNLQIGVVAHELMHALGEPDYYDTGYDSNGTGDWDLGAGGAWLGFPPQANPAHFNPLIKWNLGWLEPKDVTRTAWSDPRSKALTLRPRELFPDVYLVPFTRDAQGNVTEGHLIEFASPTAVGGPAAPGLRPGAIFDRYLIGRGLLIWHFDKRVRNNNDQNRYRIDLEEFNGPTYVQRLQLNESRGDPSHPWRRAAIGPSPALVRDLNRPSWSPNTLTNEGGMTPWAYAAIGDAQLRVPADWPAQGSETIGFQLLRLSPADVELAPGLPYADAGTDPVMVGRPVRLRVPIFNAGGRPALDVQVEFRLAGSGALLGRTVLRSVPGFGRATATITWTPQVEGRVPVEVRVVGHATGVAEVTTANNREQADVWVGSAAPAVAVVDDDFGYTAEETYAGLLYELGIPFVVVREHLPGWLAERVRAVIWHGGNARMHGQLDPQDVETLRAFLRRGGRVWLLGPTLIGALGAPAGLQPGVDPAFLRDYFGMAFRGWVQGELRALRWVDRRDVPRVRSRAYPQGRPFQAYGEQAVSGLGEAATVFVAEQPGASLVKPPVVATRVQGRADAGGFRTVLFGFDLGQVADLGQRRAIAEWVLRTWFGLGGGYVPRVAAPAIYHADLVHVSPLQEGPVEVAAAVVGATRPDAVYLRYRRPADTGWTTVAMEPAGRYLYRAAIPAEAIQPETLVYRIEAVVGGRVVAARESLLATGIPGNPGGS